MEAERKRARNWYWWLWLSPLLTIPTLIFLSIIDIGYELCRGPGVCDWDLAERVTLITGILVSSLWHLVLLKPVSEKESPFVHWHGLQALCLVGLRTAVPLAFVIVYGFDLPSLLAIPVLILIWFIGTFIGQHQASRGKCSLSQWASREDELASYQVLKPERESAQKRIARSDPEDWVSVIRFSDDPEERRQALAVLKRRNMIEEF
jgi:hypothetical protein